MIYLTYEISLAYATFSFLMPYWHLQHTCQYTQYSSKPISKGCQKMESPNSWCPPMIFFPIEIPGNQPPVGNVIPVQTSLVKKDGVEVLVFLQVAIGRRKASSLRTASWVEMFNSLYSHFQKTSRQFQIIYFS